MFVSIKLSNVSRSALNFGHTIGHAIEQASDYRLHHGYAVALGMIAEAALGERLGVTTPGTHTRLVAAAATLGLPTMLPQNSDVRRIVELTRTDKKARRGQVRYCLLADIGQVARGPDDEWTWPVDDQPVIEVLQSWTV